MPRPRNESAASARMAVAICSVVWTISVLATVGIRCRKMIRKSDAPNVRAVPYARGLNNHMGSLATTDRRVMENVFRALPKGMYFIDSRTIGNSVAAEVAHEMKVRTAARNVFLVKLSYWINQ